MHLTEPREGLIPTRACIRIIDCFEMEKWENDVNTFGNKFISLEKGACHFEHTYGIATVALNKFVCDNIVSCYKIFVAWDFSINLLPCFH